MHSCLLQLCSLACSLSSLPHLGDSRKRPAVTLVNASRLIGTYRGSRDDNFGLCSQASFNTGSADAV